MFEDVYNRLKKGVEVSQEDIKSALNEYESMKKEIEKYLKGERTLENK